MSNDAECIRLCTKFECGRRASVCRCETRENKMKESDREERKEKKKKKKTRCLEIFTRGKEVNFIAKVQGSKDFFSFCSLFIHY